MRTFLNNEKTAVSPITNPVFLKPSFNSRLSQSDPIYVQSKLTIGSPNDIYEKEADTMADKVMRMTTPEPISFSSTNNIVSRACSQCEQDKELHRKESNANESLSFAPAIVHDVLNSGGRSLDTDIRAYMEPRFNYDFSNVKIHDNDLAAKSASSINALAYTSGNNVVFNSGQFNPGSDSGKRLLAHELTHVVQQNNFINKKNYLQRAPSKEDVWGFPVTKSMCGCTKDITDDITWRNTAITTYASCDIPANSTGSLVEDCFHKAHPTAVVTASTSSSGVITPPASTVDPCQKIINHSDTVHEIFHQRHTDNIAKAQGVAFYSEWKKLAGDPDKIKKLTVKFPAETAKHLATFNDGHDWAQDEVRSYTWQRRFLQDTKSALSRICS